MKSLGEWIHKRYEDYTTGGYTEIGLQRFKIDLKLTKKNIRILREVLSPADPSKTDSREERILNLTVDVWGSAGPDCCTAPV